MRLSRQAHDRKICLNPAAAILRRTSHCAETARFLPPPLFFFGGTQHPLVKGSLHAGLAFIFMFSVEQILRFVSLSSITNPSEGENKQIRHGENVADSHHVESILFLALTRHISGSFYPLTLVITLGGKSLNQNQLVEEQEVNLFVSVCMQH